jgi:uncharacterized protein (TIGR03435 family)
MFWMRTFQKEVIVCLALTCTALAQTASISFEVATIKPTAAASGEQLSVGMSRDPARVSYSGVTLKNLVSQAYRVKDYQVTGPDWLDSDRFDLNAKIPDGGDIRQVPAMLQTLLVERFKLTLRRDKKVMPAYALVVAKNGSKLTKTEESSGDLRMMIGSKGRQVSGKVTMTAFSGALSTWMAARSWT